MKNIKVNQILSDVYFEDEASFYENGILYPFRAHCQRSYGKNRMVNAHYHEHIEILYVLKGEFSIFLDASTHFFSIGDMVVINSMEVHMMHALSEGENTYIVVCFKPELLYTSTQTIFETKYVLPFTMKTSKNQKIFKAMEISNTDIPDLLVNILRECETREYGFELAFRTNIGRIFLWILRNWYNKGIRLSLHKKFDQLTMERLQSVFDYINTNYDQPISIDHMSKLCNMSYSYFSRFFKRVMEMNFSEYVNFIKISKSEHLLSSTNDSITDIALSVGFTTTSYFIEQFKYFKNITPKKYRAQIFQ